MPPIAFCHQLPPAEARAWREALSAADPLLPIVEVAELSAAERAGVEVALVANPDPAVLSTLTGLCWVQSLWAGVDSLLPRVPASVPIVRMRDPQMIETMAEAVLTWTLYLHRELPHYRALQARAEWRPRPQPSAAERRVTILGLGDMGTAAARRLLAQGFPVRGQRRAPVGATLVPCEYGEAGLDRLLPQTDVLVLLLPLTADTRGLIDARRLAQLPAGARLINFARGALIDDDALLAALDAGHLDHAVLDVFATEPLPPVHPYWRHPRVTVTPHVSAPTPKSSAAPIAAANLRRYLEAGVIPAAVDRGRGY
ncbi:MAG: glyoxylate/hydroxypyruvate reductase A [Xanthomonadales bacterium]|jgi:glyoxylate/hydroxypyruvate reductase A|nr:glyoxylate/hydroxypyruvate reductase A [Xanthomonadales bacterium]